VIPTVILIYLIICIRLAKNLKQIGFYSQILLN
jgi:hypothetical protein